MLSTCFNMLCFLKGLHSSITRITYACSIFVVFLYSHNGINMAILTVRNSYFHLLKISRIYLAADVTMSLIHAHFISHLDCINSILCGIFSYLVTELQCLQNRATRVIVEAHRYAHITSSADMILLLQSVNELVPVYMCEYSNLTSLQGTLCPWTRISERCLCDSWWESFQLCAPKLWNISLKTYTMTHM